MRKIDVIVGARPNFMKAAALFVVAPDYPGLALRVIHTGQHYDVNMSHLFLQELGLPEPHRHLQVGSGSHAYQTATIMMRYEECVEEDRPGCCVVVGDVNSTVACALVASKLGIPVAHIEAGLRSFDRTMPEEINRVLTDSISDLMFVTESSGLENLKREGRPESGIHLVGNTMIDTLLRLLPKAEELAPWDRFAVRPDDYVYITLHRPSNVDEKTIAGEICEQIISIASRWPVVFLVHPRTRRRLDKYGLDRKLSEQPNLHLSEPLGYMDSLSLMRRAKLVITDSGGIQEESTILGIPCLTLRENTERPITVEQGTNTIIGRNWALLKSCLQQIEEGSYLKRASDIPLWDGNSGERILQILTDQL
ncbi:MAG: UDP-N-acetylglucosamine 2-epimerase (non-hydrolyzing) [Fidelibacterota bacterium]|nr:MAG: UDP-N-acetylglucosamine 2-epimerase (non-hydrolyzing) [Candidatus Neomarinimicrobiota bacterium]